MHQQFHISLHLQIIQLFLHTELVHNILHHIINFLVLPCHFNFLSINHNMNDFIQQLRQIILAVLASISPHPLHFFMFLCFSSNALWTLCLLGDHRFPFAKKKLLLSLTFSTSYCCLIFTITAHSWAKYCVFITTEHLIDNMKPKAWVQGAFPTNNKKSKNKNLIWETVCNHK